MIIEFYNPRLSTAEVLGLRDFAVQLRQAKFFEVGNFLFDWSIRELKRRHAGNNDISLPELEIDSRKTLSRINVELQTIASFPFSVTQGAFFDAMIRSCTVEIGRALKR